MRLCLRRPSPSSPIKTTSSFNVTGVDVSDAAFKADVKTVAEGKHFEVVLSNVSRSSPGIAQGVVNVKTDHPEAPGDPDPLSRERRGRSRYRAEPDQPALYGRGHSHAAVHARGPGRIKEFKVLSVEKPIPEMEAEVIPRGENNYNIRLGNMPTDNTLDGKELVIKTDLPNNADIKIPFKVIKLPECGWRRHHQAADAEACRTGRASCCSGRACRTRSARSRARPLTAAHSFRYACPAPWPGQV